MVRKRGIIIFDHNKNWIGGSYYIVNLIKALNQLPNEEKPVLFIKSTTEDYIYLKAETNYEYIDLFILEDHLGNLTLLRKAVNKICWTLFKKDIFRKEIQGIDFAFPFSWIPQLPIALDKIIFWIPDFQEKYYPEYFSEEELDVRSNFQNYIASSKNNLVLSSEDARNDFDKFYPENKCSIHVLNFAVNHNVKAIQDLPKLFIESAYFYSANQFWPHKNHQLLVDAVEKAKLKVPDIKVFITGNDEDKRNLDYIKRIKAAIIEKNLSENIVFLGFIDDSLRQYLYKNCIAFIQPSKFEGWNTSVEDCKFFNTFVLASDISVHREQLENNVDFFDVLNADVLSDLLIHYSINKPTKIEVNYSNNQRNYGKKFLELLS